MSLPQAALVFVVMAPGGVFGLLAVLWLFGWVPLDYRHDRCLQRVCDIRKLVCRA